MLRLQGSHRSVGQFRRRRHIRKASPIGPFEADVSVAAYDSAHGSASSIRDLDPEALFVHGPVMAATEQDEVGEPCLSTIGPVFDVVRVTKAEPTAREAAASVPVIERPSDGGWDGPGLSAHVEHRTIRSVCHG